MLLVLLPQPSATPHAPARRMPTTPTSTHTHTPEIEHDAYNCIRTAPPPTHHAVTTRTTMLRITVTNAVARRRAATSQRVAAHRE